MKCHRASACGEPVASCSMLTFPREDVKLKIKNLLLPKTGSVVTWNIIPCVTQVIPAKSLP